MTFVLSTDVRSHAQPRRRKRPSCTSLQHILRSPLGWKEPFASGNHPLNYCSKETPWDILSSLHDLLWPQVYVVIPFCLSHSGELYINRSTLHLHRPYCFTTIALQMLNATCSRSTPSVRRNDTRPTVVSHRLQHLRILSTHALRQTHQTMIHVYKKSRNGPKDSIVLRVNVCSNSAISRLQKKARASVS